MTLDGEGVARDPNGVTNFELLRAALGRPAKREVFLRPRTCWNSTAATCGASRGRTAAGDLARLLRGAGHGVQLSDHMEGSDGDAALRHACAMGLEGIIAKRRTSRTGPGAPPIGSRSRTQARRPRRG